MKLTTRAAHLLIALGAAAAFAPAQAGVLALDSTRVTGNQNWTGSLGMDFNVLSPIVVTRFGAYDSDRNGFTNAITVGIFDRVTGMLVGSSFSLNTGNTVIAGTSNRMADIPDFVLGAGSYSIVAFGFGAQDPNGNTGVDNSGVAPTINTGGGLISFTGTARYSNAGFNFPTIIDGGPSNRYDAGTFEFNAVPEPGSLAILGLGLLGFAAVRRRKN